MNAEGQVISMWVEGAQYWALMFRNPERRDLAAAKLQAEMPISGLVVQITSNPGASFLNFVMEDVAEAAAVFVRNGDWWLDPTELAAEEGLGLLGDADASVLEAIERLREAAEAYNEAELYTSQAHHVYQFLPHLI